MINKKEIAKTSKNQGLASDQADFLSLHQTIILCGNMASNALIEMAENLKEMRDRKLYNAGGFNSFSEYVENAVGIKERQAYSYISIIENLDEEFLQSTAKIGVTKLSMLAALPGDERLALVESIDVSDSTVKELKEEIERLKNDRDVEHDNFVKAQQDAEKRAQEVAKLRTQSKKDKEAFEKQISELENSAPVQEFIDNPETLRELENERSKSTALENENDSLRKQLLVADPALTKFKVKFEDFQKLGEELIALLYSFDEETRDKCKKALNSAIARWTL